jgi:adenylylsulfate kinase-like enzyme
MKGFVVWLTGPASEDREKIGSEVHGTLSERGISAELFDQGTVSENLSGGLSSDKDGKTIEMRRVAFLCETLGRNGVISVVSTESPFKDIRQEIRKQMKEFVEVLVESPESKTESGFEFEAPEKPEVVVDPASTSVEDCAKKIVHVLEMIGCIPAFGEPGYSGEEEEKIKSRLKDLGYI